jgi:negative regulator of replication initiation
MSMPITVNVPDNLYRHIKRLAQASGRNVADVMNSMMSVSLLPLTIPTSEVPLEKLSDAEVLELADSRMNPTQNARMSELLDKQQAGDISSAEKDELAVLVYIYEQGSLLKVKALSEAIRRGMREPVNA